MNVLSIPRRLRTLNRIRAAPRAHCNSLAFTDRARIALLSPRAVCGEEVYDGRVYGLWLQAARTQMHVRAVPSTQ